MRSCRIKCINCGVVFDRFSGSLLNLSDKGLISFYKLSVIRKAIEEGKHPVLCSDCLEKLLGRNLRIEEIKFKYNRWMTSNVCYLIKNMNKSLEEKAKMLERVKINDKAGVMPFKNTKEDTKRMFLELSKD